MDIFFDALAGKHIVLGLTGGIACYKSAELVRLLGKTAATVQVVMTEAAQQFITPVTMQALSSRPVIVSQWDPREANGMAHINLSRAADALVIAPCSADFLAKLAQGRADDLLSLLCLARPEELPLLLAPAMNRQMWQHFATQRNLHQVVQDGATVLGIGTGEQACGESGEGRMLEAADIVEELAAFLTPKPLQAHHVLITAGPTFEAIDPVRGITNHSSGKMGFALARAARAAGAQVTLVAGPVHQTTPRGVQRFNVESARDMLAVVQQQIDKVSIFIAAAAVADWRPASVARQKIKKNGTSQIPRLAFVENPDILATIAGHARANAGWPYCVGFAAESENLLEHASTKRQRKGVPLIVGNIGPTTFGKDDNTLLLIDEHRNQELPRASKATLAHQLIHAIAQRLPR